MKVGIKNPASGEYKEVKVGWSWTLFFFAGFFGLPLFLRRLYVWGSVYLVISVVSVLSGYLGENEMILWGNTGLSLICIGLNIFLAIKGNEMTAKNFLEQGWVFSEPESDAVKIAKGKWGIL